MDEKIYTLTDDVPAEDQPQLAIEERVEGLLNEALGLVLHHLGVDLSGNIAQQLEEMEIIVEHCREEGEPDIRGIYVLQRCEKKVLPVAYIGNAREQEQRIETDLVMFGGQELNL